MHECEQKILSVFSQNPDAFFTTSDIVAKVYAAEFATISDQLLSSDPIVARRAKRSKAQLHRRLLYHMQKLVQKHVLCIAGVHEKGEKLFGLALAYGELVVSDKKHTIGIAKQTRATSYVDLWLDRGVVTGQNHPLHKIEAYAINANAYTSLQQLLADLSHVLPHVSDAVCICFFEKLLDKDGQECTFFVQQISGLAKEHNVVVTLHIDCTDCSAKFDSVVFFSRVAQVACEYMQVVLKIANHLVHQQAILTCVGNIFSERRGAVHIQKHNQDAKQYFCGLHGVYSVSLQNEKGMVAAVTSFTLVLPDGMRPTVIRSIVRDVAKTCLSRVALQRRLSSTLFQGVAAISPMYEQLSSATCYLRIAPQSNISSSLLFSIKQELAHFSAVERAIFASCAAPISFSLKITQAAKMFSEEQQRRFTNDKEHVFSMLQENAAVAKNFSCSRTHFLCTQYTSSQVFFADTLTLLDLSAHGFVTCDFRRMQRTVSLTQFLS